MAGPDHRRRVRWSPSLAYDSTVRTAAVGKLFSDLLRAADWRPVAALRATGATRLMVPLYGLLPITAGNLVSMGRCSFACAVRAAVIVGAVGGGERDRRR